MGEYLVADGTPGAILLQNMKLSINDQTRGLEALKKGKKVKELKVGERSLLGRGCLHLVMKRIKKDVWKRIERRSERLKGA